MPSKPLTNLKRLVHHETNVSYPELLNSFNHTPVKNGTTFHSKSPSCSPQFPTFYRLLLKAEGMLHCCKHDPPSFWRYVTAFKFKIIFRFFPKIGTIFQINHIICILKLIIAFLFLINNLHNGPTLWKLEL